MKIERTRRAAVLCLAISLGACASAPRPIAMTCRPLGDVHVEGAPLSLAVTLTNESSEDHELLGMTVPWVYYWALRFESPGFEEPLVIADPGVYDDVHLGADASDSGDVDITQRLVDPSGATLASTVGTHHVVARGRLVLEGGTPSETEVHTTCETDVEIVAASTPIGRAYATAVAAAEAASITVSDHRLISVTGEGDDGWTFFFEHVYPAPPGGHFAVRVDAAGNATVMPGE